MSKLGLEVKCWTIAICVLEEGASFSANRVMPMMSLKLKVGKRISTGSVLLQSGRIVTGR